jgi:hypothetical protein
VLNNGLLEKTRATRRKLTSDGPAGVRSVGDLERVSLPNSDGNALRLHGFGRGAVSNDRPYRASLRVCRR